jgi:hypothetical protein
MSSRRQRIIVYIIGLAANVGNSDPISDLGSPIFELRFSPGIAEFLGWQNLDYFH